MERKYENSILQGDCTEVLKELPDESVDLAVTDPPYLVSYRDRNGRTIANDNDPAVISASFMELYRVLKPDTFCISFYSWSRIEAFFEAWKRARFRPVGQLIWKKNYASGVGFVKYCHEQACVLVKGRPARPIDPLSDVRPWEYTGNRSHPTEKAVSVIKPLIESFSRPGDLVVDPFSGSGSTAVAAAFAGRRYLGIELEAKYCSLARKRLSASMGRVSQRWRANTIVRSEIQEAIAAAGGD